MGRIALRGLLSAGCLISAVLAVSAAEKMRPPLPKPKPTAITNPFAPEVEPEIADPQSVEPEADKASLATVLPRPKPDQAVKPAPEPVPKPEAKPGSDQA